VSYAAHAACVRGAAFFLRGVRGGEGEGTYIGGMMVLNAYISRGRGCMCLGSARGGAYIRR